MPKSSKPKSAQNVDVLIIGAGVVGLSTAALLSTLGLSIAVLEQAPLAPITKAQKLTQDAPYDLRVSAINLASMRVFKHIGIYDKLCDARLSPYEKMQVWDANSDAEINFSAADIGENQLGYIIENSLIINSLLTFLKVNTDVIVQDKLALKSYTNTADGISAHFSETDVHCQLMLGADGQNSSVRSLAKIPTEMGLFEQTAMVCRIQTTRPHEQTAFQCFNHDGPIAFLPLEDGSTSIVWSCDSAKAAELKTLDDDAFALAISNAMQNARGAVEILSPRAGFPLSQQHSSRYIDQRIALIGDAAHRTHPLAGLGLNLGLQDAAVLAEEISKTLLNKRPIHSQATLRKYERRRKHQNALVLNAMQGFKTAFGTANPGFAMMRAGALNMANQFGPVKNNLSRLACGVIGDLPDICRPTF